jgi:putative hydrolases of HD superfamily
MNIEKLLEFLKEADNLKKIERQTLVHNGGRHENSAEHSWHLALAALVMKDFAPKGMDLFKAMKMALLHDIVEIDAGDTIVYGHQPNKKDDELKALNRIMGLLPGDLGTDLKAVWREFEDGKSLEAKYIHAIDRFLPIYSNYLNEGYSWKNHSISAERVTKRCEPPISEGIPELWDLTRSMLEESIAKGEIART